MNTYKEVEDSFLPRLSDFYADAAKYYLDPFRIYGNLYYVGDQKVCPHLIDTGDGLILMDTGYSNAKLLLLESIRRLGFDPADIKIIIQTHGHFDHFGASADLRRLYGCKIYMSAVDTQLLRERPDRALTALSPNPYEAIPFPDVELNDGDHVVLGNTDIRCVLSPGHTLGTMSFFFDAEENGKKLRVGYFGGVGFISIYKDFCKKYGLPLDKCRRLGESIRRLYPEPVDILLGNHPAQNKLLEKRERMLQNPGENPFIDPAAWHEFLDELEGRRRELEALGY